MDMRSCQPVLEFWAVREQGDKEIRKENRSVTEFLQECNTKLKINRELSGFGPGSNSNMRKTQGLNGC